MSPERKKPTGHQKDPGRWARLNPEAPTLYSSLESPSFAAEQYRNLAFQVEEAARAKGGESYVLALTSPEPGAGKSLTSLNLALALAREGERRVLLVEGDIWRPTLRQYLEIDPSVPGFQQLLEDQVGVKRSAVSVWGAGLDVIASGEKGKMAGLMAHRRVSKVVEEMRSLYEIVILDSPPILLASGRSLAAQSDGILVVVRAGKSKKRGIEETLSVLGPDRVIGFVLNGVRSRGDKGYSYYGTAYSSRGTSEPDPRRPLEWLKRARGFLGQAAARLRGPLGLTTALLLGALLIFVWWLGRSSAVRSAERAADRLAAGESGLLQPLEPIPTMVEPATQLAAQPSRFVTSLLAGARQAMSAVSSYDPSYQLLDYPGGDPGPERGTAADLIIRAFRRAEIDLQQRVHEDVLSAPQVYGVTLPDRSIDHRRVRNLMTFFSRHALTLPPEVEADWQAGDLVVWSTDVKNWPNHLGIVSDRVGADGQPLVIHHFKASPDGTAAEDESLGRWPIEGHFRWPQGEGS